LTLVALKALSSFIKAFISVGTAYLNRRQIIQVLARLFVVASYKTLPLKRAKKPS
jgi:hypothetical protein